MQQSNTTAFKGAPCGTFTSSVLGAPVVSEDLLEIWTFTEYRHVQYINR